MNSLENTLTTIPSTEHTFSVRQEESFSARFKHIKSVVHTCLAESFVYIQVAFVIAIFVVSFFPAFHAQREDERSMEYAVARGAGAALKILLPFIFMPTLRMLHAKTYQRLPQLADTLLIGRLFHNRMSLHKYLGQAFICIAGVHTGAHLYRRSVSVLEQESLTGISMLALSILPIALMYTIRSSKTSLAHWAFDKSYYKQFLLPHQMGWWGLSVAYALHTRDFRLLPSTIGFFGLFCIDRIWEWAESRNVSVKKIERIHDGMIVLEIERPRGYPYKTGQKAYLAYPPASAFVNHLHPFTIASSPEEEVLRFVISSTGDWTQDLVDHLNEGDVVRLSPPFPSPLDSKKSYEDRLLITSGSGIAMTLSHLHDREDESPIRIVHTTRNPEEVAYLNRFVRDRRFKVLSAEYFVTGEGKKTRLRPRKDLSNVSSMFGRFKPDESQTLREFAGRIYFCGNNALGIAAETVASKSPEKVFMRESFNF